MFKRIRIHHVSLILALAILTALPVLAQRGLQKGPGPNHFGPGMLSDRMAERLDLTEEQQGQIEDLMAQHREQMQAQHELMKAARTALRDQTEAEVFDEVAIREAAGVVASLQAELMVERALLHNQVRQVLTPEQFDAFQEIQERRRDFRGERPGRRHGGRHLHHPGAGS